MLDSKHKILVRKKDGSSPWLVALGCFNDSAALVWPAIMKDVRDSATFKFFEPDLTVKDFMLVTIFDLSEWVAFSYRWRSPLWQHKHMGSSGLAPAIRAVVYGSPEPLLQVGAKHGFWQLELSWLQNLAGMIGLSLAKGSSLCAALLGILTEVLSCSEDEALEYARHRVGMNDEGSQFHQELLELDDVHEVLDRHDVKAVDQQRTTVANHLDERKRFVEEYGKKMAARPKAKAKRAPRPGSAAARQATLPPRLPPASEIRQADAKLVCPPGGHVWLSHKWGNWQAHYPPCKRVSRSFARYGQQEALRQCIVYLWTKHCEHQGIPEAQCPLAGVFGPELPGIPRASGSSAASSTHA